MSGPPRKAGFPSAEDEGDRLEVSIELRAKRAGECRLTALATALREQPGNRVEWLAQKVCGLCLPPEEFACTVGVKVKKGWRFSVQERLLPGPGSDALATVKPDAVVPAGAVTVDVVAYELLVEWRVSAPDPDYPEYARAIAIPVSWAASVLENPGQDEAAFRSKVRWLMTELMLARYGVDSYREQR
jgi:hypothetical protein